MATRDELLVCLADASGILHSAEINAKFRWGRVIPVHSEVIRNCQTQGHSFFSLGESYGIYNRFLGPPSLKISSKRRRKGAISGSQIVGSGNATEIRIGGLAVTRKDIFLYLKLLIDSKSLVLAIVSRNDDDTIDGRIFDVKTMPAVSTQEAAEEWPFIFSNDSRVVRLMEDASSQKG